MEAMKAPAAIITNTKARIVFGIGHQVSFCLSFIQLTLSKNH